MAISPNINDRDKAAYKENAEDSGLDRRVTDVTAQLKLDSIEAEISAVSGLPNTTALSSTATVGLTAVEIAATPLTGRKRIIIQNLGNKPIYIGHDNTVATTTGILIDGNSTFSEPWGENINLWVISGNAGQDVRILETA